jgi:hypothetical protein
VGTDLYTLITAGTEGVKRQFLHRPGGPEVSPGAYLLLGQFLYQVGRRVEDLPEELSAFNVWFFWEGFFRVE